MCSRSCCTYVSATLALLVAWFLSPLLFNRPSLVKIDDVKSWGLKGPYASTLPKRMLGVYFLDGNQVPWTPAGKCSPETAKNDTICRNGWKRSQLNIIDTSYMSYDPDAGVMTQYGPAGGISEHKYHKGGMVVGYVLLLLRQIYTIDKNDPEFVDSKPDAFEGRMKLLLFGGALPVSTITKKLAGVDYRVTAEDNGDGSVIHRYTWIGGPWPGEGHPYDKPAPKSEQFSAYKYKMRRLLDADGNVDKGVLADYKKVYGENCVFLGGV